MFRRAILLSDAAADERSGYVPEITRSGVDWVIGAAAVSILGLGAFAFIARLVFLATRFVLRDADFAAALRRAGAFFFADFLDFFMDLFALRAISYFP